jgi:cation:H+ antiporter
MILVLYFLILVIGFIFLIKGADFLIDGSATIAKKFKISDLVIGLTVVAFGTSAPELVVSVLSNIRGDSEIAISNILGSNIANIWLILGAAAIVYPLKVVSSTVWKEIPLALLAVVLVGIMASDNLIDGQAFSVLSRIDGLVLLSFFVIFIYYTFGIAKSGDEGQQGGEEIKQLSLFKSISFVILGLIGLVVGGKLVVDNAILIAQSFGVSSTLIGLTIVAIGTSLPELATSVIAAFKKKADIAVGNVVGSNIFNVFMVLGISSTIGPLTFQSRNLIDTGVAIVVAISLFMFMFIGKRQLLQRWQGGFFLLLYFSYIAFSVYLG